MHVKKQAQFPIPIIIVGNISVGGTGKTPLVSYIVTHLQAAGFKPAIVMRGFKAHPTQAITPVTAQSTAWEVGDEALLLFKKTQCSVVIGKKRPDVVQYVVDHMPEVNIVVCDDGLQHYALARDIEIAVIDGVRRCGNGLCLPAGPLRESPARLKKVNFIVTNGIALNKEWEMKTTLSEKLYPNKLLSDFAGKTVHAVAGIGHPERFFNLLRAANIQLIEHRFPDHHAFQEQDLVFADDLPILMTEKDAVKCQDFKLQHTWVVPLEVNLPETFFPSLLKELTYGQKITRHISVPSVQTAATLSQRQEGIDL